MKEILIADKISKVYRTSNTSNKILDEISFTVEEGEFVGIMGPSGSGKTSLLNCISTIDKPSSGRVFVDGEDITKLDKKSLIDFRRKKIAFIFQDFNLLDNMTAYDNIALALSIQNIDERQIKILVEDISKKLGIEKILSQYPYELSGGQQQRVASARAMVARASLILADEPTGALDSKSSASLLDSLASLNEDLGATILMVTHDIFAASYCKRILFIKDGKIYNELYRGNLGKREFFNKIMDILSVLGGRGYEGF